MTQRILHIAVAVTALTILLTGSATAEWSEPVLHEELNDPGAGTFASDACLSRDGLTIYFRRSTASGLRQIVEAYRDTPDGAFTSERVLNELNAGDDIYNCWISDDELRLYYSRYESYATGRMIRMAERSSTSDLWTPTTLSSRERATITGTCTTSNMNSWKLKTGPSSGLPFTPFSSWLSPHLSWALWPNW